MKQRFTSSCLPDSFKLARENIFHNNTANREAGLALYSFTVHLESYSTATFTANKYGGAINISSLRPLLPIIVTFVENWQKLHCIQCQLPVNSNFTIVTMRPTSFLIIIEQNNNCTRTVHRKKQRDEVENSLRNVYSSGVVGSKYILTVYDFSPHLSICASHWSLVPWDLN